MAYTNSPLVVYTKISPHRTKNRLHAIDTITIHCVEGQLTAESLGDWFSQEATEASSNYGVDKDGRIGMYVEEKDRSWCSSDRDNDHRAITIEVASEKSGDREVTDQAYNALIELVADICRRNGIEKLVWSTSKEDRIHHRNGSNMTVHRDYDDLKVCPGEYLYSRLGDIANKVNERLGNKDEIIYRVQVGAYSNKAKAEEQLEKVKAAGFDAYITTAAVVDDTDPAEPVEEFKQYMVKITGDQLNIRKGPGTDTAVVGTLDDKGGFYTIVEESGTWGKLKSGVGWISLNYTEKI